MEEALTSAVAALLGGLLSFPLYQWLVASGRLRRTRVRAQQVACLEHDMHIWGTRMVDGSKHKIMRCSKCDREMTEPIGD